VLRLLATILCALGLLCAQGCASGSTARSSWERHHGGVASAAQTDLRLSPARTHAALARVAPAASPLQLRVRILHNDAPAAHCFKDGALYVSTGLLQRLSDDELAAVLAHELGHLVIDGILTPSPAALSGITPDVELHADLVARKLLSAREIPPSALTTALEKVALASRTEPFYLPLKRRIQALQEVETATRRD
jgi:Zn-dependent protease with chaperone function